MEKKEKEKERGRSRRAVTKQFLDQLDDLVPVIPSTRGKKTEGRKTLQSGRSVPELLSHTKVLCTKVLNEARVEQPSASAQPQPVASGAHSSLNEQESVLPRSKADSHISDELIREGLETARTGPGCFTVRWPSGRIIKSNSVMNEAWASEIWGLDQPLLANVWLPDRAFVTEIFKKCRSQALTNPNGVIKIEKTIRLLKFRKSLGSACQSVPRKFTIDCVCYTWAKDSGELAFIELCPRPQVERGFEMLTQVSEEIRWKVNGVYVWDTAKGSLFDLVADLGGMLTTTSNSLNEEMTSVSQTFGRVLGRIVRTLGRTVTDPAMELVKIHIFLENRPGLSPWLWIHSSITWHSKWNLVVSLPLDGKYRTNSAVTNRDTRIVSSSFQLISTEDCGDGAEEEIGIHVVSATFESDSCVEIINNRLLESIGAQGSRNKRRRSLEEDEETTCKLWHDRWMRAKVQKNGAVKEIVLSCDFFLNDNPRHHRDLYLKKYGPPDVSLVGDLTKEETLQVSPLIGLLLNRSQLIREISST
mmetsp:Transcript_32333/g.50389  ORF Transcript_32333/g.50389 Transcript_32333/m.50389 type:complete len:530 (+) Transcript_32333:23-1612(+)